MPEQPYYPHKPVGSIIALAKALGLTLDGIKHLTTESNNYYKLHQTIPKADGSNREIYLVEQPLARIHNKIRQQFLMEVKYPSYLQGGIKGRDYIQNANTHTNKKTLIKLDVANFFPNIKKNTIAKIWMCFFKFPKDVSMYLSELVTYKGCLVQGASISGDIANLVFWSRESQLAHDFKRHGFTYTRYVDDITVSSKNVMSKKNKSLVISKVNSMILSVGTKPNRKKLKIMPQNNHQSVHNLNVNTKKALLLKKERDNIRAAVYSCEKIYQTNSNSLDYKKLYDSTLGRVNNLRRLHKNEGEILKSRMLKIKPTNN